MGCDIHCYAERKTENGYEVIKDFTPFDWRSYGVFAFLAGVRNYSAVPPIAQRRGIPDVVSADVLHEYEEWKGDGHSHSWLSVKELNDFNYDAKMVDCRVSRQIGPNLYSGGETCSEIEGQETTFREFLGDDFINDTIKLKQLGAERIVFWFDN